MKQKRKKGFTLIELLAVIVILGIIAVIAVPIVKSITKEAKMKAFANTARGIVRAGDLYYSKKDMLDEIDGDMTFEFPNTANELDINGKLPEEGSMIINEDGEIALAISNGKYCVTKAFEDKDVTVTEDYESCDVPTLRLGKPVYYNPVENKICTDYKKSNSTTGIKTGCMRWYVYKMDGDNVELILDHNTTATVAWYSNGDDSTDNETNELGPLTLNDKLKADTQDQGWKVKASIITLEDIMNQLIWYQKLEDKNNWLEGYITYVTSAAETVVARIEANAKDYANELEMIKAMTNLLATDYPEITLPSYLYSDLYDNCDEDNNCITTGYWTLSPSIEESDMAWHIENAGVVSITTVGENSSNGVRPVITLSKTLFQ